MTTQYNATLRDGRRVQIGWKGLTFDPPVATMDELRVEVGAQVAFAVRQKLAGFLAEKKVIRVGGRIDRVVEIPAMSSLDLAMEIGHRVALDAFPPDED